MPRDRNAEANRNIRDEGCCHHEELDDNDTHISEEIRLDGERTVKRSISREVLGMRHIHQVWVPAESWKFGHRTSDTSSSKQQAPQQQRDCEGGRARTSKSKLKNKRTRTSELFVTFSLRCSLKYMTRHRQDYDPGRSGWGARAQRLEMDRRREMGRGTDVQDGPWAVAGGGGEWKQ